MQDTKDEGKLVLSEAEWRKRLSAEQYRILREKGTEPPFSGDYNKHKQSGTYVCAACGAVLFDSTQKYDSGSGWPSFHEPVDKRRIDEKQDRSHGMLRTEVLCQRCGGHLGHVFDDGPTGLRYCINSRSLDFKPRDAKQQ